MAFDNVERMVELLEQLVQNTSGATVQKDVDNNVVIKNDTDVEDAGGQFFSTGESRIEAPKAGGEWQTMEFPFAARSVSVRHYHPMEIAFVDPNNSGNPVVLEGTGHYSVGSDGTPLRAPNMWYRTSERADVANAQFRLEGL